MELHMSRARGELTERQLEVLAMIALGHVDADIARLLWIGETTAKRHVRDILSKLGARNRAHAAHIAHKKGILK